MILDCSFESIEADRTSNADTISSLTMDSKNKQKAVEPVVTMSKEQPVVKKSRTQ
jgi:hypothetical protein